MKLANMKKELTIQVPMQQLLVDISGKLSIQFVFVTYFQHFFPLPFVIAAILLRAKIKYSLIRPLDVEISRFEIFSRLSKSARVFKLFEKKRYMFMIVHHVYMIHTNVVKESRHYQVTNIT